MILLTLSRGKGEETVRLQLPASPAEIGETFAFLDRISLDTTATAILDVSSNVPVLYRCLYDVDVEDSEQFQKLQKLAERTEALSPAKAAIFSGALDAECVWNLEGALTVADRLDEYMLVNNVSSDSELGIYLVNKGIIPFPDRFKPYINYARVGAEYSRDDCTSWWITDGLRIWDATPKEKEKIPAVVLTASLIRNPDERLQALADELNERYGGSWLMPVFMKAIITQPKEQVYETYSPLLDTPQKGYLFHALGMLHYRCYPEGWIYERLGPDGMIALIFWGDYSYGTYDTRFMFERYVELDERWLFDLAKDPEGRKPTVTWQTYNRGGVMYGSYDEMFISLLPRKVENPELKRILRDYFRIRSEKVKVEESITVYKDATERFGD